MVVSRWKLSITTLNLNSDVYCFRLLAIIPYLLFPFTVYFTRYVTMNEMCEKMHGVLPARAQQYADEVKQAALDGSVYVIAAMANCPFEPLYRCRRVLTIAGESIPADFEFHWNYHRGQLEYRKRFSRTKGWQECEEEGEND
jgi:hypothetical protein